MRVLYWTASFWPTIGGVEVMSTQLLPALRAKGHEFCVVTSHGAAELPDVGAFDGMPVHRFHFREALARRDLKRVLSIQGAIVDLKRTFRPDLVHVQYCDPSVLFHVRTPSPAATLLWIQALLESAPTATSLQGEALRAADWVVAPSTEVLDTARRQVPEITPRSSVVPSGSRDAVGGDPPPLSFDPPRLLCLGRLVRDKGFDLALRAFARILQRFPSARLVVSGDGPERATLQQLAADLGIAHAVEFTGWISRSPEPEKIVELICSTSLVLVPSRWMEPFGLVALQAAQCGRPVVASRTGGLREIVGHGETGLLFEVEDVDGLATAACAILAEPRSAETMGRAARRRAEERFGWQPFVDAHDALYRRLGEAAVAEGSNGRG